MDCVISGRGSKVVLLVLTERYLRRTIIYKIKGKTQEEVVGVLDKVERKYKSRFKKIFKSMTMDKGCEFTNQKPIERYLYTKKPVVTAYYAHPYSSWKRGSNDNTNKIIRRFIPKGSNISKYKEKEIQRIENWINNYPRKILGYRTTLEVYEAA